MATINVQRGFTLVEMAIVMLIVGLLIGGMLMPLSAQQEIRQRQETEASLAEIREAIIGYAITNGKLPCPAKSETDGIAFCPVTPGVIVTGFVPWSTLGTKRADAWGKLFRYAVTYSFTNPIDSNSTTQLPLLKIKETTTATTYLAGATACPADKTCVPVLIFSQGKLRGGMTEGGLPLPVATATNIDEQTNAALGTDYIGRTPSDNPTVTGGEFDDIMVWIPTPTLFAWLAAAGKLN